ncbi:hypothetical protein D9M69_686220 [compost metagenome]
MAPPMDPAKPSHDFFGLILGAMGCFPSDAPTRYPKVSLETTSRSRITTCQAPSGTVPPGHRPTGVTPPATCSGRAEKLIRKGTQASVKTPAKMLRAEPMALSMDRQSSTATLLANMANSRLSSPPK